MNAGSFVYIIAHVANDRLVGPVKVGLTSNPSARLGTLRTACPNKIDIVCVFQFPTREIARAVEAAFHEVMDPHRKEGEWFDMGPARATEAMCRNVRAHLSYGVGLEQDEIDEAYFLVGAWHAEQKVIAERYCAAWESQ